MSSRYSVQQCGGMCPDNPVTTSTGVKNTRLQARISMLQSRASTCMKHLHDSMGAVLETHLPGCKICGTIGLRAHDVHARFSVQLGSNRAGWGTCRAVHETVTHRPATSCMNILPLTSCGHQVLNGSGFKHRTTVTTCPNGPPTTCRHTEWEGFGHHLWSSTGFKHQKMIP